MERIKTYLFVILALVAITGDCRRSGGGGSRPSSHSSRPSHSHSTSHHSSPSHHYSSPSYHPPPSYHPSSPSYHPPSPPSYHPPSPPSYHPPSPPSYHPPSNPHPAGSKPGIGFENIHQTHPSAPVGPPSSKPGIGFENTHQQTNVRPVGSGVPSAPVGPPSQRPGIGFDNVNHPTGTQNKPHDIGFENVHNRLPSHPGQPPHPPPLNSNQNKPPSTNVYHPAPAYHPYQPQTHVTHNNHVYYQPPVQPQYSPPPVTTTFHHTVPVYQPVYTPVYTGSSGLGNTGSFLGGYLIGQLGSHSHHHHYHTSTTNNNNYNNNNNNAYYKDETQGPAPVIYSVHHYYQNPEQVSNKFQVDGDKVVQCKGKISETFCAPNTNALCLNNGTVMCTTPLNFTTPCNHSINAACVYTKIDCAGHPPCNVSTNQTSIDYFVPCVSNLTLHYKVDYSFGVVRDTPKDYELCITAMAEKQVVTSPISSLANFIIQLASYQSKNFIELHNSANTTFKTN